MNYDEVETILSDLGFTRVWTSGSHVAFERDFDGEAFTIPKHGGQFVARLYLNQICKQLELDKVDLDDYLASISGLKGDRHD